MNFSENLENARNFAVSAAQTAAQKAKVLAAIAKANVTIYAEEDKIKKASLKLGKLYYQDHAAGSEPQTEAYREICQEIDGHHAAIRDLQEQIERLKAEGGDAIAEEKIEVVDPEDMPEVVDDSDETFI